MEFRRLFQKKNAHLWLGFGTRYFEEYPQLPIAAVDDPQEWMDYDREFSPSGQTRLIIILFSVATIPFLYLLVKKMAKDNEFIDNEYIALTAAFIYSILPLSVFFRKKYPARKSRALFFLVLGLYFYTVWIDNFKTKYIVFSGVALMMCAMFKPTFLIGMIPMLFIFPFSEIISKFKKEGKDKNEFVLERKKIITSARIFRSMLPSVLHLELDNCSIPEYKRNTVCRNLVKN